MTNTDNPTPISQLDHYYRQSTTLLRQPYFDTLFISKVDHHSSNLDITTEGYHKI